MKMIKNKRGMEKAISIYWFVILFIVAGAVIYMVGVFYGKPLDVRGIEADLLLNNGADCVAKAGYISPSAYDGSSFLINSENFMNLCHLDFSNSNDEYYLEISFKDFNSKQELSNAFTGNANLKEFCKEKYTQSKETPLCTQRGFYALDKNNKQIQVDITSIVRKTNGK